MVGWMRIVVESTLSAQNWIERHNYKYQSICMEKCFFSLVANRKHAGLSYFKVIILVLLFKLGRRSGNYIHLLCPVCGEITKFNETTRLRPYYYLPHLWVRFGLSHTNVDSEHEGFRGRFILIRQVIHGDFTLLCAPGGGLQRSLIGMTIRLCPQLSASISGP